VSAANTAAATSGSAKWLDVRAYDGEILVTQVLGAVTGTIAGKLQSASDRTARELLTSRGTRSSTRETDHQGGRGPEESSRRIPGIRGHDCTGPSLVSVAASGKLKIV
jgi:hypothetical protein